MNFRLGYDQITELGSHIMESLKEAGVNSRSELQIELPRTNFKKLDEDLYYRGVSSTEGKSNYSPALEELRINFENNFMIRVISVDD